MTLFYFAGLAVLLLAGYTLGRSRAATTGQTVQLHSRPVYHGAFVVVSILIPMLILFVLAVPIADRIVNSQAIQALDPALLDDDLKRGAALRDIVAVATSAATASSTSSSATSSTRASTRSTSSPSSRASRCSSTSPTAGNSAGS